MNVIVDTSGTDRYVYPCAFCGGDNLALVEPAPVIDMADADGPAEPDTEAGYIWCRDCSACGPVGYTTTDVELAWNRRATPVPLLRLVGNDEADAIPVGEVAA